MAVSGCAVGQTNRTPLPRSRLNGQIRLASDGMVTGFCGKVKGLEGRLITICTSCSEACSEGVGNYSRKRFRSFRRTERSSAGCRNHFFHAGAGPAWSPASQPKSNPIHVGKYGGVAGGGI